MARRYDSSTTTFSPEGRLHQVRRPPANHELLVS
jgi:20S proteasome alpha/beta subunit